MAPMLAVGTLFTHYQHVGRPFFHT